MKQTTAASARDKALAAELRERLRGLPPGAAAAIRNTMRLHAAGDRLLAGQWLLQAAVLAPDHAEVRLWQGVTALETGDGQSAAGHLAEAVRQRPGDGRLWRLLGQAQDLCGDGVAAQASLQRASALARSASDWLALSQECDRQGLYDEAMSAAKAMLRLDPGSSVALLQRARCAKALGDAATAAADCRALIASGREEARAWFSLLDLKTVRLDAHELTRLEQLATAPGRSAYEQVLVDFALGQALEAAGEPARALVIFQRANAAVRATLPWDCPSFERRVSAIEPAFATWSLESSGSGHRLGKEVVFLVGMPRSGSTLVEQVLASHPQVEGASELPYVPQLIESESRRRGRPFPHWAAEASPADWERLGREYLQLTARWRQARPISTDKLPDNWLYAAAIRAMLPSARIVDCRRDTVQACWSCFKQLFGPGLAAYSYDFASLARYAVACEYEGNRLAALHPSYVRIQSYEALVTDPAGEVRALLDFCGLPFDVACLNTQVAQRAIRTPSALQVRQPITRVSTPADAYGALLDPLRGALASARSKAL